jgi:uncharacterized protein (DUF362 family)
MSFFDAGSSGRGRPTIIVRGERVESNRRDFLIRSGKALALAGGSTALGLAIHNRDLGVRDSGQNERVRSFLPKDDPALAQMAIAKGEDPVALVRAAVDGLGGIRRFVSRGDVVAIKPNIGWARVPAQAANTNPDMVAEMVRMCLDAGAKKVIVSDVSLNDPQRCFDLSGIRVAAANAGAHVVLPQDRHFRERALGGEMLKNWPVYLTLTEADKVINMPVMKHHNLCAATGAMKNWYGLLGGTRNQLHQNIHLSIADLATFMRPTLTILDAYRVLFRNGPQGGSFRDVMLKKQVIATIDQVAADAYGITLLGRKPEELPYLAMAEERKIGTMHWQKLRTKVIEVGAKPS